MNIALAVKKLFILIEERKNSVLVSCPSITSDFAERAECFRRIADKQREIDGVVNDIRHLTGNNFLEFDDIELTIACHLWASIWSKEACVHCTSINFTDIIGRNRISHLPNIITNLLNQTSPLNKYAVFEWQKNYNCAGVYAFVIEKPIEFNSLFLNV